MESKKSASGPVTSGSARKQRIVSRKNRLIFGVVLLSAVSVVAFRQEPHPDPWREVKTGSWGWWTNRWERNAFLRSSVVEADIRDIFWLPDTDKVWAVGAGGFIVFSGDGGVSWQEQESGLRPLQIPSETVLGAIPGTANPGDSHPIIPERVPILRSVHFVDELHGWAVGDAGTVVSTSNGGETWVRQEGGTKVQLNAVAFVDVNRGWAVGDRGTILKTDDGGNEWSPQVSFVAVALHDVQLSKVPFRGWTVGEDGTILTMDDGGPWQEAAVEAAPRGAAGLFFGGNLVKAAFEVQGRPRPDLYAVCFLPGGVRGWSAGTLGDSMALLATQDGGRSWMMQRLPTDMSDGRLRDLGLYDFAKGRAGLQNGHLVLFANGRDGWLISAQFVFQTSDGGRSWSVRLVPVSESPLAIAFSTEGERGLIGTRDGFLRTTTRGEVWSSLGNRLTSLSVVSSGRSLWIGGTRGFLMSDGGDAWQVRRVVDQEGPLLKFARAEASPFVAMAGGAQRGFALSAGALWTTQDGAATWSLSFPDSWRPASELDSLPAGYSGDSVLAADFVGEGLLGWAVMSDARIVNTSDGGRTWSQRRLPDGTRDDLPFYRFSSSAQIDFIDEKRGWVLINKRVYSSEDGGDTWQFLADSPISGSTAIQFLPDGRRGWMVGPGIYATTDGGVNWEFQQGESLGGLHIFEEAEGTSPVLHGWAVGAQGGIYTTSDGKTWTVQASGVKTDLRAVRFLEDGLHGWAVGDGSTILKTVDGGKTWTRPQYRAWPAPWYYLSCALILFLIVVPAMRQPDPAPQPSVADVLASDRPIRKGDPDPLEFGRIAGGASRFLANEKTEPPLTLAVKGEWGTGKSSLMNLIRDDLKEYGFPTVWFNAWHYQTEEHLLGSLMENIQRQAIPAWWTPVGLAFRVRLLYLRGAKHWLPTAVLVFLFAGLLHHVTQDWTRVESLQATLTELSKIDLAKLSDQWGSVLALLATIFGPLLAIQRGTRTFASTTSGFLASLFGAFRVDGLEGDIGFRERFAATFRDVTRALQPRRLTIFIDDLDRCQPDKTVRVLELINFLVVSGDCFVVVGMAPDWVVRSVGLGFKDVAAEMIEEPTGEEGTGPRLVKADDKPLDGPDRAKKIRQEFARNYLEKLINIEVPLPRPSGEAVAELLTPPEPPVYVGWEKLHRQAMGLVQSYAPMLALAALVGIGYWQGPHLLMGPSPDATATTPSESAPPAPNPQVVPQEDNANVRVVKPNALEPSRPAIFIPGQTHSPPWWPEAAGILAVLVLGAFRLALGPKRLEKDSPAFRKALEDWYPLVYHDRATPRSVKRFLNRVRYYAMRQRERQERVPAWRSLYGAIRSRLGLPASDKQVKPASTVWIPEDVLVALSAIQEAYPDAIASGEVRDFATFLDERKDLADPMKTRMDKLRAYPSPAPFLELFQRMSEGVDIRR